MRKKYVLRIYPDAVLRGKSRVVSNMNGQIHDLIMAMKGIMYKNKGIGLAAPQIGILKRIIIADIGEGLLALANPVITTSTGYDNLIEGCLSLPDIGVDVRRNQMIALTGVNPEGEEVKMELSGLLARVVQHEVDHLNGVLIIDYQEKGNKDYPYI